MSETAAQVQARADATNEQGNAAMQVDASRAFALWAEADTLYRLADALDAQRIDWRRGLDGRVDAASRVALGD